MKQFFKFVLASMVGFLLTSILITVVIFIYYREFISSRQR